MTAVKVYSGAGASKQFVRSTVDLLNRLLSSRYVVQQVTAQDLTSPAWKSSTSLLVFPGGQASPYVKDLVGSANSNIKDYVKDGGKYLGFCAGAYFASKKVKFMTGTPLEVIANRPLEFFPGTIYGTTFPGFDYASEKGARATKVTFSFPTEKETIQSLVYFNGGGSFLNVDAYPSIKILARYNDVNRNSDEIAAVLCNFGKGKAILSAIHPEYIPTKSTESFYRELNPYKRTIERTLNRWFRLLDLALISDDSKTNLNNRPIVPPRPILPINRQVQTYQSNNPTPFNNYRPSINPSSFNPNFRPRINLGPTNQRLSQNRLRN